MHKNLDRAVQVEALARVIVLCVPNACIKDQQGVDQLTFKGVCGVLVEQEFFPRACVYA